MMPHLHTLLVLGVEHTFSLCAVGFFFPLEVIIKSLTREKLMSRCFERTSCPVSYPEVPSAYCTIISRKVTLDGDMLYGCNSTSADCIEPEGS